MMLSKEEDPFRETGADFFSAHLSPKGGCLRKTAEKEREKNRGMYILMYGECGIMETGAGDGTQERTDMETKRVVAAAILQDGKVFAAQRGYGKYRDGWEFPGGKIEPGESPEQALAREIREELKTEIRVGERIGTIRTDYPDFHLVMDCFLCTVASGSLTLLEHESARWLDAAHLLDVDWLPADRALLENVRPYLQ